MVWVVSNDQVIIERVRDGKADILRGVKEREFRTGREQEAEESVKPVSKELAREQAKVDSYNPSMEQVGHGMMGGYGFAEIKNQPIWDYLTPYEKKQVRDASRLVQKGRLAEAHARFGGTNMQQIFGKIVKNAIDTPREYRQFRRGVKLNTEKKFEEAARRFASPEQVDKLEDPPICNHCQKSLTEEPAAFCGSKEHRESWSKK